MRHKNSKLAILFLILLCGSLSLPGVSTKPSQLPEAYRHWLNEEVNYLITDAERDAFLGLKTNDDRDKFIENFWKIRNPDPLAPANAAKDEHYRRLAYANDHFSGESFGNGWRTDRGMVYITLGAPKQTARYLNTKYLRQMEIWFYQSPGFALPAYFSVIFYKPSVSEDYRLYSPYSDRPEKLIASSTAVNDEPRAIRMIEESTDNEVARLSLSLLPDEPVDLKDAQPSMQSDILLDKIHNYRNLPENRQMLEQRKSILEGVTHRILLGEQYSEMDVLATRDGQNKASIHYLFRFLHPQDFALAQMQDGRSYYLSASVQTALLDGTGRAIYDKTKNIEVSFKQEDVANIKNKCLGIEGRILGSPGVYQLRVVFTNNVTKQSFMQTRPVLVPEFHHGLSMSPVMFLSTESPTRDPGAASPFSFSGIRLQPIGADNIAIQPGTPLRVIFQAWEEPAAPSSMTSKKLDVSYVIGHISSSVKKQEDQEVERSSFDPYGNLLVGRDLSTVGLPPGNYRIAIKLTDPESHQTVSQAASFQIIDTDAYALWTVALPADSPSLVTK